MRNNFQQLLFAHALTKHKSNTMINQTKKSLKTGITFLILFAVAYGLAVLIIEAIK